jgi:PIN domain nuclease of toxin-antitoxin system
VAESTYEFWDSELDGDVVERTYEFGELVSDEDVVDVDGLDSVDASELRKAEEAVGVDVGDGICIGGR